MKSTAQFLKHSAATLMGLGLLTGPAHATVLVTPTDNGTTLANSILGSGITINSATYDGAPLASGTFTGGTSAGIGIDTGIILSTGNAKDAEGPNKSDGTSVNTVKPGNLQSDGNSQLDAIVAPKKTNDAASLNINFETQGGKLFFNYVMASEEYNEYANSSYNDVFGFFLDGTNIALIPGTTTPVAINNVNGGNPFGTNATNPAFYNNNDPNDPAASFDIGYDGFTTVLTAQDLDLAPGNHTISLAIADTSDSSLDSGVFIQGGSFADTPVSPTDVVLPSTDVVLPPTAVPFEFSPGLGILALGAWGAMAQLNSVVRKRKSSGSGFSIN